MLITLTSDFGIVDSYVAQMKGVILSINPSSVIVDITHEISKFNIQTGAYMLASAAPCFPKGTIHVAVVDPGVGTKRRAILITTKQGYFVGPDNGLLILAAERQGIISIYELTNPKLMLPEISGTFHGRDVFAPAAAYLEKGIKAARFGPRIDEPVRPEFVQVKRENGNIICRVLHVDSFGNIITNLRKADIPSENLNITIQDVSSLKLKLKKTYGETKPKDTMALVGSHGFLEIAVNRGNAAEKFNAKMGTEIAVTPA
ncbi:MAG: S-adenosyl-l-methionine hydroxide adenosyltransferase family protein [Candidatus Bathyarchaeia archaeon]